MILTTADVFWWLKGSIHLAAKHQAQAFMDVRNIHNYSTWANASLIDHQCLHRVQFHLWAIRTLFPWDAQHDTLSRQTRPTQQICFMNLHDLWICLLAFLCISEKDLWHFFLPILSLIAYVLWLRLQKKKKEHAEMTYIFTTHPLARSRTQHIVFGRYYSRKPKAHPFGRNRVGVGLWPPWLQSAAPTSCTSFGDSRCGRLHGLFLVSDHFEGRPWDAQHSSADSSVPTVHRIRVLQRYDHMDMLISWV